MSPQIPFDSCRDPVEENWKGSLMRGRTLKLNYTLKCSYLKIRYFDLTIFLFFSYFFFYSFLLFLSFGAIILTFWSHFISTFENIIYKLKKHSEKMTKFWCLLQGHYRYKFSLWNFHNKFLPKEISKIWKSIKKSFPNIFTFALQQLLKLCFCWGVEHTIFSGYCLF